MTTPVNETEEEYEAENLPATEAPLHPIPHGGPPSSEDVPASAS